MTVFGSMKQEPEASPEAKNFTDISRKVIELHKSPHAQSVSTSITVITIVVVVFSLIGFIAYYSFNSTLQSKMMDRDQNELLYTNPNDKDIMGVNDSLPEVQIGAAKNNQQKGGANPQAAAQQQMGQQSDQYMKTPDGKMQKVPPKPTKKDSPSPTSKPSPTTVPENVAISTDKLFSVEHEKWKSAGSRTEGDTEIKMLESSDGKYKLNIGVTKKKFDTIDAYLDSDPRGRKPKNGTESITLNGQDGKKALSFELNTGGTAYKTTAAYVFSKDKEAVYSIELDSTELDVNNKSNEDVFKKITDSFRYIEKNDS